MATKTRILIALSFLSLPIGILIGYFCNQLVYGICFAIAAYMIFSYFAHLLTIADYFFGDHAPYYITLPGAIVPFVIVQIFYYLIVGLNMILHAITKKDCLKKIIRYMEIYLLFKNPAKIVLKQKKGPPAKLTIFTHVELKDYTLVLDIDYMFANAGNGILQFTDNFGDIWHSYDHRKTFIRQKDLLVLDAKLDGKVKEEEEISN